VNGKRSLENTLIVGYTQRGSDAAGHRQRSGDRPVEEALQLKDAGTLLPYHTNVLFSDMRKNWE
jgi:hypothetical protein